MACLYGVARAGLPERTDNGVQIFRFVSVKSKDLDSVMCLRVFRVVCCGWVMYRQGMPVYTGG